MTERFEKNIHTGVLLYLHGNNEQEKKSNFTGTGYKSEVDTVTMRIVQSTRSEVRSLLIKRNTVSSFLGPEVNIGTLPPLYQSSARECAYCFEAERCILFHKIFENGSTVTHTHPAFETVTKHLTGDHIEYLKKWLQLIEFEQMDIEKRQPTNVEDTKSHRFSFFYNCSVLRFFLIFFLFLKCIRLLCPMQNVEISKTIAIYN
jgi:hypothetical protein